jgi:hypothetical protein
METGTEVEIEVEVKGKESMESMKSTWLERLHQKRKAMEQLVGWATFPSRKGMPEKEGAHTTAEEG